MCLRDPWTIALAADGEGVKEVDVNQDWRQQSKTAAAAFFVHGEGPMGSGEHTALCKAGCMIRECALGDGDESLVLRAEWSRAEPGWFDRRRLALHTRTSRRIPQLLEWAVAVAGTVTL